MARVYISEKLVSAKDDGLTINKAVGQRSTASFKVQEFAEDGPFSHFTDGQVIRIEDEIGTRLFTGFIAPSPEEFYAFGIMTYTIKGTDSHYLLDKRIAVAAYRNTLAGDMIADLYNNYLKEEGIIAEYAYRREKWNDGTSSNLVTSPVDGSLQLAPAGSVMNYKATWSTFNNTALDAHGNVTLAPVPTIRHFVTALAPLSGNSYSYSTIWKGSMVIANGDKLYYDIFLDPSNPQATGGIDGKCSDGTTIRDFSNNGIKDQNGVSAHPNSDLKNYAFGQWYSRVIDISGINSKTLSTMDIVQEGDNQGDYLMYVKNVVIKSSTGTVKATAFNGTLQQNVLWQYRGYDPATISTTVVNTYGGSGSAISSPISLASVGLVKDGTLNYLADTKGDKNGYAISASLDGGATWQTALATGASLPFVPGFDMNLRSLMIKADLSMAGTDPTISPVVYEATGVINPSYKPLSAKNDTYRAYGPDFTAATTGGTLTNTTSTATSGLTLPGYTRNFDNGDLSGLSLWGAGAPAHGITNGQYWLQCNATSEARSRIDIGGQYTNFIVQTDVLIDSSATYGFVYRTSGPWSNTDSTYAYSVEVSPTQAKLMRGTNNGAGTGGTVATYTLSLTTGNWHTLRAVVNGSSHKIYLDGILIIDATDSTYIVAGSIALRNRNTLTSTYKMNFDNFFVVFAGSGTWQSAIISVPGPYEASKVLWGASLQGDDSSSVVLEASKDSGTTWAALTNGGSLPLTVGATNTSLLLRATLTAGGAITPILSGLSIFLTSKFHAVGVRTSPALDLSPAIRAAGSNVSWDAPNPQPTSTSTLVEVSTDNGTTWTQVTQGSPVPGIYHQPAPYLDLFDSDTSGNYQIVGSWSWDTANKVLNSSNGLGSARGKLLYNPFGQVKSGYVELDILSPMGGLILNHHWTGTFNDYYYAFFDGATAYIYKFTNSGTRYFLGSTPYAWSGAHRVRFTNADGLLSLVVDGKTILSYDDRVGALVAGYMGYYSEGTFSLSSARLQPFGDLVAAKPPMVDGFDSDTSANYTSTFLTGGVAGNWTWDTANSRLTATSATMVNPVLLWNNPGIIANLDATITLDAASHAGIVWGWQDSSNAYELVVQDAGARANPNTIRVYRNKAGTRSQIGSTITINFVRNTVHTARVTFTGGKTINAYFDGALVFTYTDATPLAAGKVGLKADSNNSFPLCRFLDFSVQDTTTKTLMLRTTLTSDSAAATPSLYYLSTGMRSNKIDAGPLIPEATFNYAYLSDSFDKIAELSNCWLNIDENNTLWFKLRSGVPSPYIATEAIMMDNVSVTNGNPKYRNRQYAQSSNTTDIQHYSERGGYSTHTMAYPLASVPTVSLNGQVQTVGIKGVDTGMFAYWSKGDPVVSIDDTATDTLDDTITVDYYGLYDFIHIAEDTAQVQSRKALEGGTTTGYVDAIESVDATTSDASAFAANARLQQYSQESKTISFDMPLDADLSGGLLKEGQLLRVKLAEHDLNHDFLIEQLSINAVNTAEGVKYEYSVKGSYGAISDNWVKFFDALAKPVNKTDAINVGTGQVANVGQVFTEPIPWVETVTPTATTCFLVSDTTLCGTSLIVC